MKRGILHLGKYVLLLLFLLCFGYILSVSSKIGGYQAPVIYYMDGASFSADTVNSMREEAESGEEISWTAVRTLESQSFSNETLHREATGTLLLLDGNSSNLVAASAELMADDRTGCILSTEAAWELFGETEISGGEIICNQMSYEVRCVYEDSEVVILLSAESYSAETDAAGDLSSNDLSELSDGSGRTGAADAEEAEFDKIVAVPGVSLNDAQRSEAIETFETKYPVGEDKTDCMIYQRLSSAFVLLIPALVLICVIFSGAAKLIKNRRKIIQGIIGCAVLAVLIALYFILFQIRPSIPADLIPNTWSDFDFWKDKLAGFAVSIRHLLYADKSEIELKFFQPLVRMSAAAGIGVILFILTLLGFRADEGKAIADLRGLMISLICTCITEFIVLFLLHRWGISPDESRMLIYLWPYFLVSRYAIKLMCP